MEQEVEILVDVAVLGQQVEIFLGSRVGKFLMDRAENLVQEGLTKLRTVDPTNPELIRAIQNEVWKASTLKDWLEEAIIAGLKATEVLEERDE